MKRFCFRFDVDTENRIKNGVPKLLGLAERLSKAGRAFVLEETSYEAILNNFLEAYKKTIAGQIGA